MAVRDELKETLFSLVLAAETARMALVDREAEPDLVRLSRLLEFINVASQAALREVRAMERGEAVPASVGGNGTGTSSKHLVP